MKKAHYSPVAIGVIAVSLGLLPIAALAESDGGVQIHSTTDVSTGERNTEGDSVQSSTTLHTQVSNQEDAMEHDGHDMTSITKKHKQEGEHGSSLEKSESNNENNDGEIDIDQESADTATSTIDTADHVSTRGELHSFLNHLIKEDDHISDVHVSSTSVETHYEIPAKFLGIISTDIKADVVVNADGSVSVTYPWYAFLFAKDGEIANMLRQSIAPSSSGTASTTVSASAQAHMLNLLFSALKGSQK